MSPVEALNNAIVQLAFLNPENLAATTLNDAWQAWFEGMRQTLLLPDRAWWLVVQPYWYAYAAARASAKNLNERTPEAMDIDPTAWAILKSDAKQIKESTKDAAVATGEAIVAVAKPTLFVVGVIGVGLILWSMRK